MPVFKGYSCYSATWQQHNHALQWLRTMRELEKTPFDSPPIRFSNFGHQDVATVRHELRSNFEFTPEVTTPWCWKEMVAQLRDDDIEFVVGDGLIRCELSVRRNSYDIERHWHKRTELGVQEQPVKLPVWDFCLYRSDGTGLRLHPTRTNGIVNVFPLDGDPEPVVPRNGLGQCEGAGTLDRYLNLGRLRILRFDQNKVPFQ